MRCVRNLIAGVLSFLGAQTCAVAAAQWVPWIPSHVPTLTRVSVVGQARTMMTADWSTRIGQHERAYCVTGWLYFKTDGLVIMEVKKAPVLRADGGHIQYLCPVGNPTIHTHPEQTCSAQGECIPDFLIDPDNPDVHCALSDPDIQTMSDRGDPWSAIQCHREKWIAMMVP